MRHAFPEEDRTLCQREAYGSPVSIPMMPKPTARHGMRLVAGGPGITRTAVSGTKERRERAIRTPSLPPPQDCATDACRRRFTQLCKQVRGWCKFWCVCVCEILTTVPLSTGPKTAVKISKAIALSRQPRFGCCGMLTNPRTSSTLASCDPVNVMGLHDRKIFKLGLASVLQRAISMWHPLEGMEYFC